MKLFKKKKQLHTKIQKQRPWQIIVYSRLYNEGTEEEFDDGYIELVYEDKSGVIRRYKELAWIRGEKNYSEQKNLFDIWNFIVKMTPGTIGIRYDDWLIQNNHKSFIYQLSDLEGKEIIYKNIIGEQTVERTDFAAFLEMLDNIKDDERNKETIRKNQKGIFDLKSKKMSL